MSQEALTWVLARNHMTTGHARLLLIAFAHEADAVTGYCFPNHETLHQLSTVSVSSIHDLRERLVSDGQLLALPPSRRGRGHHYRYVVVMGRDPYALADLWGWPRPALSPEALATERRRLWLPVDKSPPTRPENPRRTGVSDTRKRDRKTTGIPPPGGPSPAPSQRRAAPSSRSALPTLPRAGLHHGPDIDARLRALQRELGDLEVSWHMTTEQARAVAALVDVHGTRPLAELALRNVTERGLPTFARAWLGSWRDMPIAGGRPKPPWCGRCDRDTRLADRDSHRPRRCEACHPLLAAAF
jgi:hypothetical protein